MEWDVSIAIGLCSRELWAPKVPGLQPGQFRDNFETPTWESQEFVPFGCSLRRKLQRILYGGRWWFPPNLGRGESSESKVVPTPKGCKMSSNQLVVGFDADSSEWIACHFPSLIPGTPNTTIYPFLVLEVGSVPQVPTFRNSTLLDPQVGSTWDLGAHHVRVSKFCKNLLQNLRMECRDTFQRTKIPMGSF